MKVTNIAICALIGVMTRDEAVKAVNLNRLSGNVCISEIGEDTNELLGLDNNYELVELENETEPPAKIEKDMAAADAAKHEAAEKKEHEEEAKVVADKAQGEETKKLADGLKKEADATDKKATEEAADKKKKADEESGVAVEKNTPEPKEVSVTGYLRAQNAAYDDFAKKKEEEKVAAAKKEAAEAAEKKKDDEKDDAAKKKTDEEATEGQSPAEKENAKKATQIADEEAKKAQGAPAGAKTPEETEAKAIEDAGKVDPTAVGPPEKTDLKKQEEADVLAANPEKAEKEQEKQKQRNPEAGLAA